MARAAERAAFGAAARAAFLAMLVTLS